MPSKKFNKICTVCGEKAIGFNFCAISCESCKAFFRRNASKIHEYKCPFNDNCKIDQFTRKFCRKCRLKKCFAVGMKQEWILSDEERELRRIKIEANKKGRKWSEGNINIGNSSYESFVSPPTETISSETNGSDTNDSKTLENNISDEEIIINLMEIEDYLSPNSETAITPIETTDQCLAMVTLNSQLIPIDTNHEHHDCDTNQESNEISDYTYEKAVELELAVLPIPKPIDGSTQLNEVECNRLIEIFNATLQFRKPFPPSHAVLGRAEDLSKFFVDKIELFSKKFINIAKSLGSFNDLCQNDQIALVKYSALEVLYMRTALYYDSDKEQWSFFLHDNKSSIIFKLECLQQIPVHKGDRDVYDLFKSYLRKIIKEYDNDPFILDLLLPILLFNPDRPNVVHKEPIKLQQQLYMYLLQRYLLLKKGNECETKVKFLRILDVIQDLQKLNYTERHYYRHIDPNILGPLAREILDVNTTNTYIML